MSDKRKLTLSKALIYTESAISLYSTASLFRTLTYFRKPAPSDGPATLSQALFGSLGVVGNIIYVHGVIRRARRGSAGRRHIAAVGILQTASHLLWSWTCRTVPPGRLTRALSRDTPRELVITGPYAYMRNPFYSAYLMSYAATATLSGRTVDYVLLVCFYVCYYLTSLSEQRKFEESDLAEAYARFKATRVRFFIGDF